VNTLEAAFDELVPATTDFGDWGDVLARAGVGERPQPAQPRRRRRALLFLAVAAALLAPAAIVAAILARTNVIFSSSKPAPNLVKKKFSDLGFHSGSRFGIEPLAALAREVGTFSFGGHRHKLWVVPTRRGGFCWTFERSSGGCTTAPFERSPIGLSYLEDLIEGTIDTAASQITGIVERGVERVQVRYADGSTSDVPVVYVSPPIDAGFFAADIPARHFTKATRATAVVALDGGGRELGRSTFRYEPSAHRPPRRPPLRTRPATLPAAPPAPPSEPAQRGLSDGFSVVAGANGVFAFQAQELPPFVERLIGTSVNYGCFKLVREFGIFGAKGTYVSRKLSRSETFEMSGPLPHPWDGCEIQASYGHRWPDRNGSHSAVEIPLTATGRRYFADRAAARDLALFVRSRSVKEIRGRPPDALARGLGSYPIVRLASPDASPPAGKIGWAPTPGGATFVERSRTGRRFVVEVRNGKVVRTNVKPYAFVF